MSRKKLYFDMTEKRECISIFALGGQIIPAGTTVYSMSVKDRNEEYRRYAEEYDIHFIFDDCIPKIDFYTVPWVDIMAVDSEGGLIGTIGQCSDLQSDATICYIDRDRNCYRIAENGAGFLANVREWKKCMEICHDVVLYPSKEDAEKKLEFLVMKTEVPEEDGLRRG